MQDGSPTFASSTPQPTAIPKIHVKGQLFPLFKLTWLSGLKQVTHAS